MTTVEATGGREMSCSNPSRGREPTASRVSTRSPSETSGVTVGNIVSTPSTASKRRHSPISFGGIRGVSKECWGLKITNNELLKTIIFA